MSTEFQCMQVSIQNKQRKFQLDEKRVLDWTRIILSMQKIHHGEISLVFVNNRRIRIFNKAYRFVDRPTNVLAFPMREGPGGALHPFFLGDVMISLEMVKKEARLYRRTWDEQLLILLIHGILHLLGYDHTRSAREEARMMRREKWIFNRIHTQDRTMAPETH
ncbi:MAG: rRNA maturation RNase YbeY [Nitrospiria bacterium]